MDIPAAWHPDPLGRYEHRYWDGQRWTEHVANQGIAGVDATGLDVPATGAQQAGAGWGRTPAQQPVSGQASTGQQPAAQSAAGWGPVTSQPSTGQQPAAQPAAAADDAEHWRQPWTAPVAATGQGVPSDGTPAGPASAGASTVTTAEQPVTPAAGGDDRDHWQRPWIEGAAAAAAPTVEPEAEPVVEPDPAPTVIPDPDPEPEPEPEPQPSSDVDPGSTPEPETAAPSADAVADWQQPWEAESSEAREPAQRAAAPQEQAEEPEQAGSPPHWQQPWTSGTLSG